MLLFLFLVVPLSAWRLRRSFLHTLSAFVLKSVFPIPGEKMFEFQEGEVESFCEREEVGTKTALDFGHATRH